ncbi:MAG: 1-acyl-sn-glycerol-3-phosphate acyltransferase [Anaerolineae bacterium]|nr:1-acyl-sn-glycerol-3-phosphate acyltransferase [Anaerolineae bacterium]
MLNQVLYKLGRPVVNLYAAAMFDMDVIWEASLPEGPKIIAPNHPSTTDPFLIAGLVAEPTSILIDDRLFKVPVFGRYLHLTGHVPVVNGNGREAFEAAKRLLGAGQSIAIFPEGTVSPLEGGLHRPRTGAARLALSTGAPIIPVGIHLQRERIHVVESRYSGISATGSWYLRGPYAMTVGKPMTFVGDIRDREYVQTVSEHIIQRIAHLAQKSAHRMNRPTRHGTRPLRQLSGEAV